MATAIRSAITTENQIPLSPKMRGRRKTGMIWKTRVRINEISADVSPSLSAVKNPEEKDAYPIKKNDRAKILNPFAVML